MKETVTFIQKPRNRTAIFVFSITDDLTENLDILNKIYHTIEEGGGGFVVIQQLLVTQGVMHLSKSK